MWAWTAASLAVHAALIATFVVLLPGGSDTTHPASQGVAMELLPAMPVAPQAESMSDSIRDVAQTKPASAPLTVEPEKTKEISNQFNAISTPAQVESSVAAGHEQAADSGNHVPEKQLANAAQARASVTADEQLRAAMQAKQAAERENEQRNLAVRSQLERFKHYPASAKRRGIEGAVDVSFRLNAQGRAENIQLVTGSGYAILDDAALDTVKRAEPFPVTRGSYHFRLRFTRS